MNPYEKLPVKAFWKSSVGLKNMFEVENLWEPKFNIKQNDSIITYGSCFAQHMSTALSKQGFTWLNTELPPRTLSVTNQKIFNYNIFSSRTGNIYTASLLKQWLNWAFKNVESPNEFWKKGDRFYCPFRPNIEPNGFNDIDELFRSRQVTIESFRKSILNANYFIFTLGLTESWLNSEFNYEYPLCPGTVAGTFNERIHVFKKQTFNQIVKDLKECIKIVQQVNKDMKFIFTVSPIPLTATNTNNHVLIATMESKSILRAVAGQLCEENSQIDYFPSYELINAPIFRGVFFEPNMKKISQYGVNFVMDTFFKSLYQKFDKNKAIERLIFSEENISADEICEEALLELFGNQE